MGIRRCWTWTDLPRLADQDEAIGRFFAIDLRDANETRVCFRRITVHEGNVREIQIHVVEKIAIAPKRLDLKHAFSFEFRETRQLGGAPSPR